MRIAVLGCGSIGRRHLANLAALNQREVVAFDASPEVRETIPRELAIPCHASLEEIWAFRPEAVLVAAPTRFHLELALAAAERACHLFIEKPLSHTLENARRLASLVRSHNLVAMVGCNMRFHPGPTGVKELLDRKVVGRILSARLQSGSYLPDWRPWQDYRASYSADPLQGGALLDCIHELDLALWYFGRGQVVGSALLKAESLGIEVEGLAEILIRHQDGALVNVHLNFLQRDYRRCCQIIGELGTIYWDFENPWLEICRGKSGRKRIPHSPDWQTNQMYVDELSYFLRCIERGQDTFCTVEDGIAALEIVLQARRLAEEFHPEADRRVV
jgi:predicted dehydrogenase